MLAALSSGMDYNKTCVTSIDQPIHPPSMARVLIDPSFYSPEVVDGTCNQQRCGDVQSDLSLCWLLKSYCRFCHVLAHIVCTHQKCLNSEVLLLNTHNISFHGKIRIIFIWIPLFSRAV